MVVYIQVASEICFLYYEPIKSINKHLILIKHVLRIEKLYIKNGKDRNKEGTKISIHSCGHLLAYFGSFS
jgi:hypothetical protein